MANNIAVADALGASKTFKTTETGGVHVGHQNVDLIAAGQTLIGKVGEKVKTIEVVAVTQAAAYATGDVIGGKLTFASPAIDAAGDFTIRHIGLRCKTALAVAMELFLFNADPTSGTYTENGPVGVDNTDLAKMIGVVKFATGDMVVVGSGKVHVGTILDLPVKLPAGNNIYGYMVVRGAYTPGDTSNITVHMTVRQN